MNISEIIINLVIGITSGVISGFVVYILTKRKESLINTYYFWFDYLLKTLEQCDMYIPSEQLRNISVIDEKNSEWSKAINKILQYQNSKNEIDGELTENEAYLLDNVLIALKELNKWADNKKIIFKESSSKE